MSISSYTTVTMLDSRPAQITISVPKSTDIANRIITFKDLYGSAVTSSIVLVTQTGDTFEDGTFSTIMSNAYQTVNLYAGQPGKWLNVDGGSGGGSSAGLTTVSNLLNAVSTNATNISTNLNTVSNTVAAGLFPSISTNTISTSLINIGGNMNAFITGGRGYLDINGPPTIGALPGALRILGNAGGTLTLAENVDLNVGAGQYLTLAQSVHNSYIQFQPDGFMGINSSNGINFENRGPTNMNIYNSGKADLSIYGSTSQYLNIFQNGNNSILQFQPGGNALFQVHSTNYLTISQSAPAGGSYMQLRDNGDTVVHAKNNNIIEANGAIYLQNDSIFASNISQTAGNTRLPALSTNTISTNSITAGDNLDLTATSINLHTSSIQQYLNYVPVAQPVIQFGSWSAGAANTDGTGGPETIPITDYNNTTYCIYVTGKYIATSAVYSAVPVDGSNFNVYFANGDPYGSNVFYWQTMGYYGASAGPGQGSGGGGGGHT